MNLSIFLEINIPLLIGIWGAVAVILLVMLVYYITKNRKSKKDASLKEKNKIEEPRVRQPKSQPKKKEVAKSVRPAVEEKTAELPKEEKENSVQATPVRPAVEEKRPELPKEEKVNSVQPQTPSFHADGSAVEFVDAEKAPLFVVMYNKSFRAKLSMGTAECRNFYQDLKSYLLAYGLKSRMAWSYDTIYLGRVPFARFSIRGKTLSMNIALNPEGYEGGMYEDNKELKKYADVPLRIKVKSNRTVKLAKAAIDLLAKERGYVQKEIKPVELEPVRSLKENLKLELVKKLKVKRAISLDSISAEELEDLEISSEVEENIKQVIRTKKCNGKKEIINIDTISKNYQANEVVTVESLISKKLISSKVQSVKCLARGILDKPLVFQLNDYSRDAIKMILATNGKIE